jgi:hypothetical protein
MRRCVASSTPLTPRSTGPTAYGAATGRLVWLGVVMLAVYAIYLFRLRSTVERQPASFCNSIAAMRTLHQLPPGATLDRTDRHARSDHIILNVRA